MQYCDKKMDANNSIWFVLDTNVYLHYKWFEEIPWDDIAKTITGTENVNVGIDKKKSVKPELCYAKWQIGNNNYTNEELYLMEELQDTMKFESFIYGFIQSYNPIDLYKIPLSFTEEFLSILSKKKTKKHKQISYLSLFDNLYENNMDAKIEIDFIAFKANFIVKYKTYFDREIIDSFKDKFETVNFNYEKLLNYGMN